MDAYEHIDDYVNGKLEGKQLNDFQDALAHDDALRQAVENHPAAMDVVGAILEDEVRSILDADQSKEDKHNSTYSKDTSVKPSNLRWMKWAAAACGLALIGWWGFSDGGLKALEKEIFASYLPILDASNDKGGEALSTMDSIKYFFAIRDYEKTDIILERYDGTSSQEKAELANYKMFTALYQKQYKTAISIGESIDAQALTSNQKEILFLSYLLTKDKTKAKAILQRFSQEQKTRLQHLLDE